MSEFTSNFWVIFIAVISLLGIIYLATVLWFACNVVPNVDKDGTTGHVWDEDLREMNNPIPKWWVRLFIITMVFAVIYSFLYISLGQYKGQFNWNSLSQYELEVDKSKKDLAPIYAAFDAKTPEELAVDPNAIAVGERLFANNCSQCHGYDARGGRGFPNLTDGDWIHGGTPDKIKETLVNGRIGMMPPMAGAVGNDEDVKNVANYVLSLSGSMYDSGRAGLGKEKFTVCAGCHGVDGKGNQAIGAPNLTDRIWLHGAGEAAIIRRIYEGKVNQMPAQAHRLTESQIHVLVGYIWSLSNVKKL